MGKDCCRRVLGRQVNERGISGDLDDFNRRGQEMSWVLPMNVSIGQYFRPTNDPALPVVESPCFQGRGTTRGNYSSHLVGPVPPRTGQPSWASFGLNTSYAVAPDAAGSTRNTLNLGPGYCKKRPDNWPSATSPLSHEQLLGGRCAGRKRREVGGLDNLFGDKAFHQ